MTKINNITKAKQALRTNIPTEERVLKKIPIKILNIGDKVTGTQRNGETFIGTVIEINTDTGLIKRDDKITSEDMNYSRGDMSDKGWEIVKRDNNKWYSAIEEKGQGLRLLTN